MNVEVVVHGPLFDKDPEGILRRWTDDLKDSYGQQGLSQVQQYMDQDFKHPTPYYETQVLHERIGDDQVIHDRGIVYGPWLEGVGRRNATTRFKGYHMFRRTWQALLEDRTIIDRAVTHLVDQLNGTGTG